MTDKNFFDYTLLAPGPVSLHPEVRRILSLPMIHHRTPEFDTILHRVLCALKKVFHTEQPVYLHSSTGTGGMESLLINTLSPGDQVLAIVSGKFGERWSQMAQTFGYNVTEHHVEWGQSVNPNQIDQLMTKNPHFKAVLCQACETSTGAAHPIQELGQLIKNKSNCLFLVDGITALGAYPLPMDDFGIDGLVGGSQKAFMLPTGLSFVSFSKKAWNFIPHAKTPRFYFDIRLEDRANKNGETMFSSSVSLIRALDYILQNGFENQLQDIHRRAQFTRLFMPLLGMPLFAKHPSDSITALVVPSHLDGQKIRAHLEKKYNITIMGGQDQAKGKIIRIGHMGYINDADLVRCVQKIGLTLNDIDPTFMPIEKINSVTEESKQWLEKNL